MTPFFHNKKELLKNNFEEFRDKIPQYLMTAKARSTLNGYSGAWARIVAWCIANGKNHMPLKSVDFTAFLIWLAESNQKYYPCRTSVFACQLMHKINGRPSPLEDNTVHLVLESIQRRYCKAPSRARPTTSTALEQLYFAALGSNASLELLDLRIIVCMMVQFGVLGRCSEIRNLKVKDLRFRKNYMVVRLGKSKANQFEKVTTYNHIYATGGTFCPVKLVKQYLQRLGYTPDDQEAYFLPFIKITKTKTGFINHLGQQSEKTSYLLSKDKGLSYNQVFRERKRILAKTGIKTISHKSHGERRGGASTCNDKGFSQGLISKIGRWKSLESVQIYCDMTPRQKKALSRALYVKRKDRVSRLRSRVNHPL